MKLDFKSIIAGIALMSLASPAQAQFAANSDAPITGGADKVEYAKEYSVFSGQVDVRQDNVRILSDVMKVYSGQSAGGDQAFDNVSRIEAIGNFYYITPEQEVKGDQGVYERTADNFIVTGNVILLQGEDNVVTGDRLVYTLADNKAVMTGNCKGRKCGQQGRVNILIKNTNGRR